jgi:XTP/dITP diphosphohydrolase
MPVAKQIIYLASTNEKKLKELSELFSDVPGVEFALPPEKLDVEETGATFAENAKLKAVTCCEAFQAPCLADDSGLCVDALDGRPGIYSARYEMTDERRIAKLLGELSGVPEEKRTAAFVCAIAVAFPDGRVIEVEGRCPGVITESPSGAGGFGYDPVFGVPELGKTFAELGAGEKNQISHRGVATRRLKAALL